MGVFLLTTLIIMIDKIVLISKNYRNQQDINNTDIKNNKDVIYELFNDFPESKNIYYTSRNLYSERDIGPTIYEIEILAELTDIGYDSFIKQVEFNNIQNLEMKINPNNIKYNWKEINNIQILNSKDIEDISVKNIYLDESNQTIYIVGIGGN